MYLITANDDTFKLEVEYKILAKTEEGALEFLHKSRPNSKLSIIEVFDKGNFEDGGVLEHSYFPYPLSFF